MSSYTSDVDAALIAKLAGDAVLAAVMPGGVWWDVAKSGSTRFVLVSQFDHEDRGVMPGRVGVERIVYMVKSLHLAPSAVDAVGAGRRIHELLQHGTLAPVGYTLMAMHRTERINDKEVDPVSTQFWYHVGGYYEVLVCPTSS